MSDTSDSRAEVNTTVKCLVWDLDNTLWRGTLLEGDEVELSDTIRDVVVALDARGILQSIASRNDHDYAWEWLEKLGIAEYFVLPQIGWGRKSDAVSTIADQLDFALGTITFIDDQPPERAEVQHHLPEVRCYPAEQAAELVNLPEFRPATVTVDARRRRQMYQAGFQRDSARASFDGPDEDFLRSLNLVMVIDRAGEEELSRVAELTLRTSQMNATGVHYSDQTLRSLLPDEDHEVLVMTLTDRFGPHGAVGVLLIHKHVQVWHLKLLATSCRVMSFGAGSVILRWLIDEAARAGVHLVADFKPTARNRIMEVTYRFAGFTDDHCECRDHLRSDADGVLRMHLLPSRVDPPPTIRVTGPMLTGSTAGPVEWTAVGAP
jgi:methoxymalonate biosynthesis protein